MKILLVQAHLGRKEPEGNIFPIGLCYIASALKDHDVRIMDLNLFDDPYSAMEQEIASFRPAVVGISLRNIDTTQRRDIFYYYKTIRPTAQRIKKADPSIKIMIGGTGFSMFAERIMQQVPEMDFGVYLEGDESAPELVANLDHPEAVKGIFIRRNGAIVFTGPRTLPDLAKIPIPRRDLTQLQQYYHPVFPNIGIQTKRGCPQKCAYCSYPFLNGTRVRVRSAQSVVDEIEYLVKDFNIKKFMFADSIFNLPTGHAEAICEEIIKSGIRVEWSAWFEIKTFTEELMNLAKRAGCVSMSFSPDAASDASLVALGKSITEADIKRVIRIAKSSKGVKFGFSFFCTPPRQDMKGFLKTLQLYFTIIFQLFGRGGASLSWIRVEPETRMHQIAVEDGILKRDTDLLPGDEAGLKHLFYSCPTTRWYADPVFYLLYAVMKRAKTAARAVLRRGKKPGPVTRT
jgi:anaerobic magnesium-protoporphyrin IX monomethyl ester cyclase